MFVYSIDEKPHLWKAMTVKRYFLVANHIGSQTWKHIPVIPVLQTLKKEDLKVLGHP